MKTLTDEEDKKKATVLANLKSQAHTTSKDQLTSDPQT